MSGGSMDYLYAKVRDAQFGSTTTLRRAFHKHLEKVVEALHAIEWNDSGDGDPDEDEKIRACLGGRDELDQAIADAKEARDMLARAILDAVARGGVLKP